MLNIKNNSTVVSPSALAAMTYSLCPSSFSWNNLAEVWDNNPDFKDCDVFLDAIHKVMWGFAPEEDYCAEYLQFIDSVADVLENCDEAVEAFRTREDFVVARDYVASTMDPNVEDATCRHTIIHYHYLRDRLMSILEYERKFCSEPNTDASKFWRAYESAIIRLIPAAASWTRAQWGNENNIHDALLASHGVDYRERFEEFDRVILLKMLFREGEEITNEIAWYAMNITRFPYSLAEVFWPTNTMETIIKLFLKAFACTVDYERRGKPDFDKKDTFIHATGIFDREDLKSSWMFRLCSKWYEENVFPGKEGAELKRAIFSLLFQ